MRQDKDRSSKWLLTHHGDAILKLGGITGFTKWKALQPETIAPRRLPDGLFEVEFPGEANPTWVLVEIETYPNADADRQVLDDLMLITLERRVVPEVVFLVLKPKGNLAVAGTTNLTSPRGRTQMSGSWPVVRLWELDAETLLTAGDVGFVPWASLAHTALPPETLLTRCRDRIAQVTNPTDREGLLAVTQILAGLAFPNRRILDLFGGADAMIESPVLDEVKAILAKRYEAEGRVKALREAVISNLETRFPGLSADRIATLNTITDETRLKELHRLAITCPDVDAFVAALTTGTA
jgi:hypothetical protein